MQTTSHRFTELDFLAWIAAAVFLTLPIVALLLGRSPVQMTHETIAVPPVEQSMATAYLPLEPASDSRL